MIEFIDLKTQQSCIAEKINRRINAVFNHGRYIMGPEIEELEEKLANYVGTKHCIGVSSGTDALLISLMAIGLKPNDEVIVPDFSFFATAEVVCLLGAKPIFCDIEAETCNLNPSLLEELITDRTKAIIPVNLYGQCAELNEINRIAKKHSLLVVEDGAQSFGAKHYGERSLSLSDISCTSFFPSKPLGCYGDGGACFTNNDDFAQAIRELRIHGQKERYLHTKIGLGARLDTIQAAILLEKLDIFESELEKRQDIASLYDKMLPDTVRNLEVRDYNLSAFAQYTITSSSRSQLVEFLKGKGIPTAVHYPLPLSKQPVFKNTTSSKNLVSSRMSKEVLSLPFHPYLKEKDIKFICGQVSSFLEMNY